MMVGLSSSSLSPIAAAAPGTAAPLGFAPTGAPSPTAHAPGRCWQSGSAATTGAGLGAGTAAGPDSRYAFL